MYLALKWLTILSVAMWAMLCVIDLYSRRHNEIRRADYNDVKSPIITSKNFSGNPNKILRQKPIMKQRTTSESLLNYLTFCAGALVITLYNRKNDIIQYSMTKLEEIKFRAKMRTAIVYLNGTAHCAWVAILEKTSLLWENLKIICLTLKLPHFLKAHVQHTDVQNKLNNILLAKLREVGQERNNLGQLLVVAIQENRNIRLQYQLENLAKNRLLRQVEDTQKQIRENRSRYVNFQQLYLVTHQENIFLKSRVKRLARAKEDAENKFMTLVGRVFQCKDNRLKAYCTNFMMKSKEHLLNSDMNAEIKTYLTKTRDPYASTSNISLSSGKNRLNLITSNTQVNQGLFDDAISCSSEIEEPTPKFRGLPGECVWTLKDKDGIIEKLYEYDHGYDFDNGDTIRRIREYSVYHDKDCLLDFKNSRSTTVIHERPETYETTVTPKNSELELPSHKNFLTGSPVFQKFMENQKILVSRTLPSPSSPMLCC